MNRIAMLMPLLALASCTSGDIKTGQIDVSRMIFVPPVDIYETTHCIAFQQVRSTRVIDRVGIAYEMPNRKIWFNRPQWGASLLQDDLVMVSQTTSNMLCSGDIVRFVDSSPVGIRTSIALGPFIRYSAAP